MWTSFGFTMMPQGRRRICCSSSFILWAVYSTSYSHEPVIVSCTINAVTNGDFIFDLIVSVQTPSQWKVRKIICEIKPLHCPSFWALMAVPHAEIFGLFSKTQPQSTLKNRYGQVFVIKSHCSPLTRFRFWNISLGQKKSYNYHSKLYCCTQLHIATLALYHWLAFVMLFFFT